MGQRAEISISVGDLIDGKFRVQRVLGSGGGGVVVSATHMHLDQLVALKIMRSDAARDVTLVTRFLREARAASRLKGEHVARVTDVGMPEQGTPYMVMEYLEGEELGSLLRRRGQLPVGEAVSYVLQACDAVAEAHALGIVHRDIKPANLFLTRRSDGKRCIKVLDFGISKTVNLSVPDDELTSSEAVLGTPHYMAPEQMRASREADRRSDIWGLGVVLYTLLAGHRPFRGETMAEIYAATLRDPPPPLNKHRADVPDELERVIGRCLEKEPVARHQYVQQLALALVPFLPAGVDAPRSWPHALAPAPRLAPLSSDHEASMVDESPQSAAELAMAPPGATGATWSNTWMGAIRRTPVTVVVPVVIAAVCLVVGGGALVGAIASSSPHEPADRVAPVHTQTSEDESEPATETAPSEAATEAAAPDVAAPDVAPSASATSPVKSPRKSTTRSPAPRPPRDFGGRK